MSVTFFARFDHGGKLYHLNIVKQRLPERSDDLGLLPLWHSYRSSLKMWLRAVDRSYDFIFRHPVVLCPIWRLSSFVQTFVTQHLVQNQAHDVQPRSGVGASPVLCRAGHRNCIWVRPYNLRLPSHREYQNIKSVYRTC